MENASKALLMAAGLLISILVVSLLIFVANQMADYQKSETALKNVTQLSDFNEQFTQYVRDDLKGVDLISLVNKVVDYNKKTSGVGEINYDQKITISIGALAQFRKDYGTIEVGNIQQTSFVFGNTDSYTINANNATQAQNFLDKIDSVRNLENTYGLKTLDVLSSSLSNLENAPTTSTDPRKPSKSEVLEQLVGKATANKKLSNGQSLAELLSSEPDKFIKTIKTYREYSEFKTSKFRCTEEPTYTNGQISKMKFEYVSNI